MVLNRFYLKATGLFFPYHEQKVTFLFTNCCISDGSSLTIIIVQKNKTKYKNTHTHTQNKHHLEESQAKTLKDENKLKPGKEKISNTTTMNIQ